MDLKYLIKQKYVQKSFHKLVTQVLLHELLSSESDFTINFSRISFENDLNLILHSFKILKCHNFPYQLVN